MKPTELPQGRVLHERWVRGAVRRWTERTSIIKDDIKSEVMAHLANALLVGAPLERCNRTIKAISVTLDTTTPRTKKFLVL